MMQSQIEIQLAIVMKLVQTCFCFILENENIFDKTSFCCKEEGKHEEQHWTLKIVDSEINFGIVKNCLKNQLCSSSVKQLR